MTTETVRKTREPQITNKDRLTLPERGFTVVQLTGKSIRELIENGDLPISEYKINPNLIPDFVLDERSRISEVAYDLNNLFITKSRKASYADQLEMLNVETNAIRAIGVRGMQAYMVSISEAAEIAAIELAKEIRIFGRNFVKEAQFSSPWIRTSTEINPDTTAIIGCDDLDINPEEANDGLPEGLHRGIHIRNSFPKVSAKHSALYIMRVFVPTF